MNPSGVSNGGGQTPLFLKKKYFFYDKIFFYLFLFELWNVISPIMTMVQEINLNQNRHLVIFKRDKVIFRY